MLGSLVSLACRAGMRFHSAGGFHPSTVVIPSRYSVQADRVRVESQVKAVIRIGRNEAGRDFVAGDIHGCYRTLERALESVRFDSRRDRLFSVGDLINRGPASMEALAWLTDGRIHAAVRGNHEEMFLNGLSRDRESAYEPWTVDPGRRRDRLVARPARSAPRDHGRDRARGRWDHPSRARVPELDPHRVRT